MERESFEDEEVANILNKGFISVKVDREERPDIDSVYMSVCQALTGRGGWPLTIIMDSDKKPFFAGTYLPKNSGYGAMGLMELLPEVLRIWNTSKSELDESVYKIMEHLKSMEDTTTPTEPKKEMLHHAYETYAQMFDSKFGGFGGAPKFPTPHILMFLMRYAALENNDKALNMATHTMDSMFRGGIYDHIGGGFSRYSTDRIWLAPHFEKMLYDNALLLIAYSMAYNKTKSEHYSYVITQTINYCLRELKSPENGFYCGEDADSEGVEGKFYVFTPQEIIKVLGNDLGERFNEWFGIDEKGNFEGKSIPNLIANKNFNSIPKDLEVSKAKLLEYRKHRTSLHRDDKVLTAWNSLMICGLISAYMALGEQSYLETAIATEKFIDENLSDGDRLYVRYRDNESIGYGKLDDYAFYSWALIELYQSTFDTQYLKKALKYAKVMCDEFFDSQIGGFYLYSKFDEQLITRPKDSYDSAMPSGNSVAALVLEKLYKLTGELVWKERSRIQLSHISTMAKNYPVSVSFGLFALTHVLYPSDELVAVHPTQNDLELLKNHRIENPNLNIIVKTAQNQGELEALAPFTTNFAIDKDAEFFLCTDNACKTVTDSIKSLIW
ncbi:MAG: thioredoxin domain-containing protein [Clostridiales bacterium]|nr:thioredoxin domain-containing protein [Clostridiales bacterium]